MLYRFLFIAVLLCSYQVQAQTIDKLDKANGFKEFKMGKSHSKWEDELKQTKSGAYRYTGKNAAAAFGSSIHSMYLRFDSLDKLSGIYVNVKGFNGKGAVSTYKKIIGLNYGKETKKDDGEKEVTYYWQAANLTLILYAWEEGNTWDAKLTFTNAAQYAADNAAGKENSEK